MNQKEKITLFFCDIYGTIDGGFTTEDSIRFASLLEQIRIKKESDYIFFGMASTEHQQIVDEYEEKLSEYFNNKIILVPKVDEIEVLREIKSAYTLKHIEKLLKTYEINEVFLIDDTKFNHDIFETLLMEYGIKLNSIVPKENENYLRFINEQLEKEFLLDNNKSML